MSDWTPVSTARLKLPAISLAAEMPHEWLGWSNSQKSQDAIGFVVGPPGDRRSVSTALHLRTPRRSRELGFRIICAKR